MFHARPGVDATLTPSRDVDELLVRLRIMDYGDDSYDLTLAAASLRSSSGDVHILLNALCAGLADTVGEQLHVERSRGRLRRSGDIIAVRIAIANESFEASVDGPMLRCSVGHSSGGIRIRSESLDVDEWIIRLLGALQSEAAHSENARQALENIVIGGHRE
ncbi:MAG: hypothetical protein HKL86_09425 [Acidimicrobiaceae bacterium]|nr:hypothetical protein [Acidimicrobiaceae bacterium]